MNLKSFREHIDRRCRHDRGELRDSGNELKVCPDCAATSVRFEENARILNLQFKCFRAGEE